MPPQALYEVEEASQVAVVRRAGSVLAETLGYNEVMAGRVALVITEAATNILKHAVRGRLLLRAVAGLGSPGIEILAIDAGPGIANLPLRMEDGNSSVGSYGAGLGTMRRQSADFDIYTVVDRGTAIRMLMRPDSARHDAGRPAVGVVCVALAGEAACGDAWTVTESAGCVSVAVIDGLGHGVEAARASEAAVAAVEANPEAMPADLMWTLDGALRSTRGAAAAVARIDLRAREMDFAGVGNIGAALCTGETRRHMVSHNGIVGSNVETVRNFHYAWADDSLLVMHSDGIGPRWDLAQYPGLAARHPGLIAAVLYRDFARPGDDATVVVVRER